MYKFKLFLLTGHNSRPYPVINSGFLFLSCDNNNLYVYDRKFPGIWSYNLSTNLWSESINSKKSSLPSPEDKIIGIIKEENEIKIFSKNKSADEAKTRLHICNLGTKEVEEKNLHGFFPDSESFCQMNIFYHNNYYYALACVGTDLDHIFGVDIFRVNLINYRWEFVEKSSAFGPNFSAINESVGIIYSNNKIYFFISSSLSRVWTFDLEINSWDVSSTSYDSPYAYAERICPDGREFYSMSSFVNSDSNEKCLILSSGENLNTFNANSDIWILNLISFKWKCLGKFGDLSHQCFFRRWASVTPNGKLVTCDESSDDRKSRFVFSRKVYSAWTRIPMLVDICWDAVLYYYPELLNRSKDDVQNKFGVPWKLVQMRIR